jgi:flagellar hook-associated protein 2
MAEYLSGSINFQGLGSGTDFSSIIAQLKKIESIPMQRMETWKADWQTRYEAFGQVLDSIRQAKDVLAGMNSVEKFIGKLGVSSNPSAATISVSGTAADGTHSLEVKQLASNAVWSYDGGFTSKDDAISTQNTTFTYTYKGKSRTLDIAGNTGLSSFVNMVNNDPQNLGIRASVVQSGGKYALQIQGKESGADATLSIAPSSGLSFLSAPSWKSSQSFTGSQTLWSGAGEFKCTVDGTTQSFVLGPGDTTVDDLIAAINGAFGADTASLDGQGKLVVKGASSVKGPAAPNVIDVPWWRSTKAYAAGDPVSPAVFDWTSDPVDVSSPADSIHSGPGNGSLAFTINGREGSIAVPPGTSLQTIVDTLNGAGFGNIAEALPVDALDPSQGWTLSVKGASRMEFSGLKNGAPDAFTWESESVPSASDPIHYGPGDADLSFTINGVQHSVAVAAGGSLQDTADAINAAGLGNIASIETAAGGVALKIDGASQAAFSGLKAPDGSDAELNGTVHNAAERVITGGTTQNFTPEAFNFTVNGTQYSVDVVPGVTGADDLAALINAAGAGNVASLETGPDGNTKIVAIAGASAASGAGIAGTSAVSSAGFLSGDFEYGGWAVTEPSNAVFRLDNWPSDMESSSNAVTGVLEGVTINLADIGKTQFTVSTDMDSVRANIQKFLDAVNSVRSIILELSNANSGTYNFSVVDSDASSETKALQGSPLTGNYGVQLLDSRMKSLMAGTPPGFEKILGDDLLSGDLVSSLSQIGIKTISDKNDPNYGLLAIAPASDTPGMQDMDLQKFENALANNLDSVVAFLAGDDTGSSSSAEFRYYSHVKGGTKAGTYKVEYTVAYPGGPGSDPVIDVYIDGRQASRDSGMTGYHFTSASGPSAGLAIQIDDLGEGSHSGKVSIKQGKIRETEDFLNAELKDDTYGNNSGTLVILQRNYTQIMTNIDKKIEREQTRISNWERMQKLAFSRLDTLLAQYTANQERLESEIAKLE